MIRERMRRSSRICTGFYTGLASFVNFHVPFLILQIWSQIYWSYASLQIHSKSNQIQTNIDWQLLL
jgi:hypothetical protein